ncbi:HalOD1 output domain-containing protein [Natronoarchaeum rubrum]|uniref:HalOD1 output domain-containing protein n=1 Tax=Natronoarchaeum rubrum TaxID=755311 RepID=UPI002111A0B5|nr:HalOD1 output domain-containing protein [Natronoarchaeum rubrum]
MQALVNAVDDRTETNDDVPIDARIAEAVAEAKGVDTLDLDPMYGVIDPDALDAAVRSMDAEGSVAFEYEGFSVTVTGDGRIDVTRPS